MNGYIIALDQGTTSSRSIIFDSKGNIVSLAQYPFTQIYPKPGWVEHDPMVILESQMLAMSEAFEKSGLSPTDIAYVRQSARCACGVCTSPQPRQTGRLQS